HHRGFAGNIARHVGDDREGGYDLQGTGRHRKSGEKAHRERSRAEGDFPHDTPFLPSMTALKPQNGPAVNANANRLQQAGEVSCVPFANASQLAMIRVYPGGRKVEKVKKPDYIAVLRRAGIRITRPRRVILSILAGTDDHPDAMAVFRRAVRLD